MYDLSLGIELAILLSLGILETKVKPNVRYLLDDILPEFCYGRSISLTVSALWSD